MKKQLNPSWTMAIGAAVLALAGCASGVKLDEPAPLESRTPSPVVSGASGAGSGASTAQSSVANVDLSKSGPGANSGLPRVVYFDYDSYVVKDEFRSVVEAQARALAADRSRRVAVEGHTDERGGREYNLALGQKRAEAVAKSMTLLGATGSQIEAVSFGEERPAVSGNDESAWAKNRRAEINPR